MTVAKTPTRPRKKAKRTVHTTNGVHTGETTADGRTRFPPELYEQVAAIEEEMAGNSEAEIRGLVNIGRKINTVLSDKEKYGGPKMKDLAALFKTGKDLLRPCYVLATKFSDPEVSALVGMRGPSGAGLHRAHLRLLTQLPDTDQVMKLAKLVVDTAMTRNELAKQVQAAQGGKRSKGGRKRAVLKDAGEVCVQVAEWCENWDRQDREVWRHGYTKLVDAAVADVQADPTRKRVYKVQVIAARKAIQEMQVRLMALSGDLANFEGRLG